MKRFIVLAVWTSLSLTAAAQAQPGKKPPFDLNAQVTSVNQNAPRISLLLQPDLEIVYFDGVDENGIVLTGARVKNRGPSPYKGDRSVNLYRLPSIKGAVLLRTQVVPRLEGNQTFYVALKLTSLEAPFGVPLILELSGTDANNQNDSMKMKRVTRIRN